MKYIRDKTEQSDRARAEKRAREAEGQKAIFEMEVDVDVQIAQRAYRLVALDPGHVLGHYADHFHGMDEMARAFALALTKRLIRYVMAPHRWTCHRYVFGKGWHDVEKVDDAQHWYPVMDGGAPFGLGDPLPADGDLVTRPNL